MDRRKRQEEGGKPVVTLLPVWPLWRLEVVFEVILGQLLLVGAELEVLRGQF